MSLGMSMSVRQNLWQSQSIELKQSLVQKFKDATKVLMWKAYPPSDEILIIESLVENFSSKISDQEVKSMMEVIFDDNKIKQMMLDEAILLSMPKKQNIYHSLTLFVTWRFHLKIPPLAAWFRISVKLALRLCIRSGRATGE